MIDGEVRAVWLRLMVAAAATILLVVSVRAQDELCDPGLDPIAGGLGYELRARNQRCEGLYESPVHAIGLEVVSLLHGRLDFDPATARHLTVAVPDAAVIGQNQVNVRAVALPLKTYYRMDARIPAGGSMLWPVHDILAPASLGPDRLGVFGWIGSESDKTFVPVSVVAEDAAGFAAGARVELGLRAPTDLESLVWRVSATHAEDRPPWTDAVPGPVRAGQIMRLILPDDVRGLVDVEFAAKRPNLDQWLTLTLHVMRP